MMKSTAEAQMMYYAERSTDKSAHEIEEFWRDLRDQFAPARIRAVLEEAAASITRAPAETARRMLEVVVQTTSVANGSVMLRSGDELEVVATVGQPAFLLGRREPRGHGVAWRVVTSRRELHLFGVFERRQSSHQKSRCAVVIPIASGGEILGTLNLNRQSDGFTSVEFLWARFVAQVLGQTLAVSARLQECGHPWLDPIEVVADMVPTDERRRAVMQQTARAVERSLGRPELGHLAARVSLAAKYLAIARALLPDGALPELGCDLEVERIVWCASSILLAALGVDPELQRLVRLASEHWDDLSARR